MSIRAVNLVWEQKFRGAYPVSPYALDDDGTLTLALPRPMEARAYCLTALHPDGSLEERGSFTVETLLKLDVATWAGEAVGMTADDLYLFHRGGKTRFLGERQIFYVDAALSADGQRLVTAFSDRSGAHFALTYGEIGGRALWTQDWDATLSVVALSRNGAQPVCGAEGGPITQLDATGQERWRFEQSEPVRALAASADGTFVAYGTAQGAVGLLDAEGARLWETRLPGEVFALALSGDGAVCAALSRQPDSPGATQIACLVGNGQVGWEYLVEARLLGLSLSASGRYLATSARDGTHALYALVPGQTPAETSVDLLALRTQTEERERAGDLEGALRLVRAALEANPADLTLFELYQRQDTNWRAARLVEAETLIRAGNLDVALALLETMRQVDAYDPETLRLLNTTREARSRELRAEAARRSQAGADEPAERILREAIQLAPRQREARQELAALRTRRAEAADAEARRLRAQGDLEAALAALEQAQAMAPTAERAAERNRLQTEAEFAEGKARYDAKQYREAIFQFKKILARVPDHAEAARYLGFAEKFAQDAASDTLSDRFRRLE